MVTKKSGEAKSSRTQNAMGMALQQQQKKTKVIEKLVEKNIVAEVSGRKRMKDSERRAESELGEIALAAAAKKKQIVAKSPIAKPPVKAAPPAKAAVAAKPKPSPVVAKAAPAPKPVSLPRAAQSGVDGAIHTEVESLGAGIVRVTGDGMKTVVDVSKNAVGGLATSVMAGTRGVVDAVRNVRAPRPLAGPVATAAKTATDVTGKVADGVVGVAKGAGTLVGYVVTGATAAPVDLFHGVSRLVGDLVVGVSGLAAGKRKKKDADGTVTGD
ncbi:MAG: hypothetical protein HQK87_02875 [Nitrospinae bacterium]|nr:hypothetical protein [Nitrospinota bacterium]